MLWIQYQETLAVSSRNQFILWIQDQELLVWPGCTNKISYPWMQKRS